jgi:hypothetical protein
MKIDKPGIYRNIEVNDYHADPCPAPSFSQSIGKILLDQSPLHAKIAHPKLTPVAPGEDDEEKYVKAKIIGDAAHALMIGRGKNFEVAPFADWRTKDAKMFKESALAAGKTPIIQEHHDQAHAITLAAKLQLASHAENDCFKNGSGEVALIWQEGPLWFRCLADWLHDDLLTVDDYKTTAMSVAPHVLGVRAADAGWEIQAAMIERGLDVLDPNNVGKRCFRFIAQEQDAPYAMNVMLMSDHWLGMGQKKLQYAIDSWSQCMALGVFPGYPNFAITPEYPGWKESQWLNREIHEAAQQRAPMLTSLAGG